MPASLCLLIATFLWGSSFIALKYAINLYDPAVVIFLRMLTTLVVCILLWRYVKRFNYQRGDWKFLVGMSLAEPCLYFLFEGYALEYTSAGQAGVIVSCLPLIIAVLAYFLLNERLSKSIIIGFTLCISGSVALTLVSPDTSSAPNPLLGNTLEFIAMICAAFYTVSVKHLSHRYSPMSLIALQGISGSLFFGPFLFFVHLPEEMSLAGIGSILYLGIFVTLGGYGLYNYAISKVSVLTAAAFSNLIPVFTLFLAALLLNESLTLLQWLAIGVVFSGVMVSQRHKSKAQEQETADEDAIVVSNY
ncbi:DMT family transporter [Thalassotalea sp. PLHSN55]|uniref:DMT family transporter n=1 Tax=Thalassotalea sp. PLHSN55 TaxID=3435888 RepID=UPI003F8373E0